MKKPQKQKQKKQNKTRNIKKTISPCSNKEDLKRNWLIFHFNGFWDEVVVAQGLQLHTETCYQCHVVISRCNTCNADVRERPSSSATTRKKTRALPKNFHIENTFTFAPSVLCDLVCFKHFNPHLFNHECAPVFSSFSRGHDTPFSFSSTPMPSSPPVLF